MKSIEFHVIQSVPVNCLNRDESGSPKNAMFGSVRRARISSQCLKKAWRDEFKKLCPKFSTGTRTRWIAPMIQRKLEGLGIATDIARELSSIATSIICGIKEDKKCVEGGEVKSSVVVFMADCEISQIASAVKECFERAGLPQAKQKKNAGGELNKAYSKAISDTIKKMTLSDGADIALHGRMASSTPALMVDGAMSVANALSVHKCDNESDYFTVFDERGGVDQVGAGMLGNTEFNSACYYVNYSFNLDQLAKNLSCISVEERREIMEAEIKACLTALPSARRNSMFANTPPSYVMAVVRNGSQGRSYANAFETAVTHAKVEGYIPQAIRLLKDFHTSTSDMISEAPVAVLELPGMNINKFCKELANHVV